MKTETTAKLPSLVERELWEREYDRLHSIPSSTREGPAKALQLFAEIINCKRPLRVLDAGCGNGRNSVYLAREGCEVTAVDFCEAALKRLRRRIVEDGLENKVRVLNTSLDNPLPFPASSFDLVLDCYTFCHFLREDAATSFWVEMARLTCPDGHLLSVVFSREDAYYAQFLRDSPDGKIICDPTNGIPKQLYSEDEIKAFLSSYFQISFFAKFEFDDLVQGKHFRRVILISVLRKPST